MEEGVVMAANACEEAKIVAMARDERAEQRRRCDKNDDDVNVMFY